MMKMNIEDEHNINVQNNTYPGIRNHEVHLTTEDRENTCSAKCALCINITCCVSFILWIFMAIISSPGLQN